MAPAACISISIILLIFFSTQASGTPHFIHANCTTANNYTQNSFYKTNLNQLLLSLTAQSSSNTFYNLSVGSDSNKVNALYYCRGDLSVQDCNDCVKAAADAIVSSCPAEKEAVVWYQECTLRYSNRSIFSVYEENSPGWLTYSWANVSNPRQFLEALAKIVDQLTQQAASNTSARNYAKGKIDVTASQTIYCLVQCTPDLNSSQCSSCLEQTRSNIPFCCPSGSNYATINFPSCRLMYDIIPFGPQQVHAPSSSPTTNQSSETKPNQTSSSSGKGAKFYVLAIVVPVAAAVVLLLGVLLFCFRHHKKVEKISKDITETDGESDYHIEGAAQFDLGTMKTVTNNFSPTNKLGQGGFGVVYKGKLQNGQEVAVKRLSQESKQGIKEFINEVELVVKLQHRNLVRLVGFCTEAEERLVVYEFMPKLSLDYYLLENTGLFEMIYENVDRSKSKDLPWETRYKIVEGIARGLHYLHEDSRLTVVHRDLKSSNILLDEDMNPKIADFGIAKHVVVDQTQGNTTKIMGTLGYMAPEYALAGQFSVKSDVFSFGVILLEIVSGQTNSQQYQLQHQEGFLVHAWKCWIEGEIEELIDPTLRDMVSRMEVGRCIQIGLLCVQYDPASRPTMHAVLLMLNSRSMELPTPSAPSPLVRGFYMNPSRDYQGQQTGSQISTGAWNLEKDLYPR